MYAHDNRVSALQVSPDGTALASCSWDCNIKVCKMRAFKVSRLFTFLSDY